MANSKQTWITIPIDKLVKADWNYKKSSVDERYLMECLQKNIERNGQIENLIVRELENDTYEVVNGNHRFDVMKNLGLTEAYCFNLGNISLAAAKRVAVETNETKFSADSLKLSSILCDITSEFEFDDVLATLPYNEEELNRQLRAATFSFDNFETNSQEDYVGPPHIIHSSKVEFTTKDNETAFKNILAAIVADSSLGRTNGIKDGDLLLTFLQDRMT